VSDKLVDELRMWPGSPGLIEAAARAEYRIEELERALLEARRVLGNMLEDGDDADRRQAMDVWDKLFRLTTTGGNDET
jgi:hypothetical protein